MKYQKIKGDLIKLATYGNFDVIAHGCNCFNTQKAGIAKQMAYTFGTDMPRRFPLEGKFHYGDINKLGQIEWHENDQYNLTVVNCYTQYRMADLENKKVVDYSALILCLKKINHQFEGQHIGLPMIGAGLAGGDWDTIERLIKKNLKDCKVTVVKYIYDQKND